MAIGIFSDDPYRSTLDVQCSHCGRGDGEHGKLLQRALDVIGGWDTNAATARAVVERDMEQALSACGSGSDHTEIRRLAEAIGLALIVEALDR